MSGISRTFLGLGGQKALVAADPFHPSSALVLNRLSGGINDPFTAATTEIEAGKLFDTTKIGTGMGQGT